MLSFSKFFNIPLNELKPRITSEDGVSKFATYAAADTEATFDVNIDGSHMWFSLLPGGQRAGSFNIENSTLASRQTGQLLQDVPDLVFVQIYNKIKEAWSYVAPEPEETEVVAPEQDVAEELKQDILEEPKQDEPEPSKPVEEPKPAETVTEEYDPLKIFTEAAGISKWSVYPNRSDDNDFVVQADGIFYRVTKWKTGAGLHVIEVHPLSDNTKVLSIAYYSKINAISNAPVEDRILIEIIDTFEGE